MCHRNETLDAYLDDTPVLQYAALTTDYKCQLRLVENGFGEDAYAIGLQKDSWLKVSGGHMTSLPACFNLVFLKEQPTSYVSSNVYPCNSQCVIIETS